MMEGVEVFLANQYLFKIQAHNKIMLNTFSENRSVISRLLYLPILFFH